MCWYMGIFLMSYIVRYIFIQARFCKATYKLKLNLVLKLASVLFEFALLLSCFNAVLMPCLDIGTKPTRSASWFVLKRLFCLPRSWIEMVQPPVTNSRHKNRWKWPRVSFKSIPFQHDKKETMEITPGLLKNTRFCRRKKQQQLEMFPGVLRNIHWCDSNCSQTVWQPCWLELYLKKVSKQALHLNVKCHVCIKRQPWLGRICVFKWLTWYPSDCTAI